MLLLNAMRGVFCSMTYHPSLLVQFVFLGAINYNLNVLISHYHAASSVVDPL